MSEARFLSGLGAHKAGWLEVPFMVRLALRGGSMYPIGTMLQACITKVIVFG